jgi:hypothetical protein
VPSYWIVDPDQHRPELVVFELSSGAYDEIARVVGAAAFRAERPFPVEVVPAHLVAGLFPR